jgi:hypothetical protein
MLLSLHSKVTTFSVSTLPESCDTADACEKKTTSLASSPNQDDITVVESSAVTSGSELPGVCDPDERLCSLLCAMHADSSALYDADLRALLPVLPRAAWLLRLSLAITNPHLQPSAPVAIPAGDTGNSSLLPHGKGPFLRVSFLNSELDLTLYIPLDAAIHRLVPAISASGGVSLDASAILDSGEPLQSPLTGASEQLETHRLLAAVCATSCVLRKATESVELFLRQLWPDVVTALTSHDANGTQ